MRKLLPFYSILFGIRMSVNWKDFFYDSDRVTNVKIVCNDGIVFTHKIIVASVNSFFKDIISCIPTGDEAILIMQNYDKIEVQNFLRIKETYSSDKTSRKPKKINDEIRPVQIKNEEIDELFGEDLIEGSFDCNDQLTENVEKGNDDLGDHDEDGIWSETIINDDYGRNSSVKDFLDSMEDNEKQEYHQSITTYLRELEKREKMVLNPCNEKAAKLLDYTQTQIKFEKAKLDLLHGKFKSYREAAKMFGLNSATLNRLFKQKRSFTPPKRGIMAFSYGEEEAIIEEYVKRNNGEKSYNKNLLLSVIMKKIRTIRMSHPERDFSKYVTDDGRFNKSNSIQVNQFVWRLAKRFDLVFPLKSELDTKFKCELCEKSYTLKNVLTKHVKDVHLLK